MSIVRNNIYESSPSDELTFNFLNEKLLVGEPVTVEELRDILHKKVLNFEFIKLNGEVRPAKGTTMPKYIPSDEQPTGDNPSSDKVAAFYDLSKNAWRSVSNRSDEIVLDVDEETGKPKIIISDKVPKTEDPASKLMPKEKDVEQRPLTTKSEPIVRPSVKPANITPISTIKVPDKQITAPALDIKDPNIAANDVNPEDISIETPEEEIEEPIINPELPEEPEIEEPINQPIVTPTISGPQPDLLVGDEKLPPKEDITFPDEEEIEPEEEENTEDI